MKTMLVIPNPEDSQNEIPVYKAAPPHGGGATKKLSPWNEANRKLEVLVDWGINDHGYTKIFAPDSLKNLWIERTHLKDIPAPTTGAHIVKIVVYFDDGTIETYGKAQG